MRDPFSWSLPLGRLFGVTIRVHLIFPLVALGLVLRVAYHKDETGAGFPPYTWVDALSLELILLVSVIIHEFGHCFAARRVGGDAREVLLWPLGGLASVEVPHNARAHFLTAAAGPAVNVLLCVASGGLLVWATHMLVRPPFNPIWYPYRLGDPYHLGETRVGNLVLVALTQWGGEPYYSDSWWVAILARSFWINWVLLLLNLLPGYPLDGGRMTQALLWPRLGFRPAMVAAVYAGFVVAVVIGVVAVAANEILTLCLALFIFFANRQQLILLETGGEESPFGYDFSQGYTSLDEGAPARRRRRPGVWQRWQQARAARRLQREQELREAEERRMDELLEKVQRLGVQGLTDEERRFMKRVSDRYRNRQ